MKSIRKWLEEEALGFLFQHHQPHFVHQPYPATVESQMVRRGCNRANHTASSATWTKHAFASYESANRGRRARTRSARSDQTRSISPETRHPQAP